jgi:hypothetical protein
MRIPIMKPAISFFLDSIRPKHRMPFWQLDSAFLYKELKELIVGEFRKTRHPRNVELNEVLKACFSGAGNSRFSEAWNL